jgi:hypothetical protein
LFAPHELYKAKPRPSPQKEGEFEFDDEREDDTTVDNDSSVGVGNFVDDDEGYHSNYNKVGVQIGVPSTSPGPCEYWRLPRKLLHSLRAKWALEEENFKLDVLRKVPGLADCLNELELRQIADLSEQVSYAAGALVVKEGSLIDDLMIITSGFASFSRGGEILMETVGPGAFWGDLSLVQV